MSQKYRFHGLMGELVNDFSDELDHRTAVWKETTRIANMLNVLLGKNEHNDHIYQSFCREFGEEIADALINAPGVKRAFIFPKGNYPSIVVGTDAALRKNNPGSKDAEIVRKYFDIVPLNKIHDSQKQGSK